MTTLILLTSHPGGLDYDLDQNSNYPSKNDKVLMSPADTPNLLGKIWIVQKQGLPIVNIFLLKWAQQWVKRDWKSRLL
jgi:hypothetical protein